MNLKYFCSELQTPNTEPVYEEGGGHLKGVKGKALPQKTENLQFSYFEGGGKGRISTFELYSMDSLIIILNYLSETIIFIYVKLFLHQRMDIIRNPEHNMIRTTSIILFFN